MKLSRKVFHSKQLRENTKFRHIEQSQQYPHHEKKQLAFRIIKKGNSIGLIWTLFENQKLVKMWNLNIDRTPLAVVTMTVFTNKKYTYTKFKQY